MSEPQTVVGLVGKKLAGKDTLADALVARFGAAKFGFADAIYEQLAAFLGIPVSKITENKEPYYRMPLQDLGIFWRQDRPTVWIDNMIAKVEAARADRVVITGVRMLNERDILKDKFNATLVRIIRIPEHYDSADALNDVVAAQHITETEQDQIQVDVTFNSRSARDTAGEIADRVAALMGWEAV